MPIHASNVMIYDEASGSRVRVGYQYVDGRNVESGQVAQRLYGLSSREADRGLGFGVDPCAGHKPTPEIGIGDCHTTRAEGGPHDVVVHDRGNLGLPPETEEVLRPVREDQSEQVGLLREWILSEAGNRLEEIEECLKRIV